jgi:hypothetical protein
MDYFIFQIVSQLISINIKKFVGEISEKEGIKKIYFIRASGYRLADSFRERNFLF